MRAVFAHASANRARYGRFVVTYCSLSDGGAAGRVVDLVFDGSLRTQLAQLRAQLTGER